MSFPGIIEGSCFTLRPSRIDEANIYRNWFADQEVTRWLSRDTIPSLEEETDWIKAREVDANSRGWTIEVDGRPVGLCGFDTINWVRGYAVSGTVIGDKSVWGRGIAREMMALRRDWAFSRLPLRKLVSSYVEPNLASGRAQAAAGYQISGRSRQEFLHDGVWYDMIHTEILRSEWEVLRAAG